MIEPVALPPRRDPAPALSRARQAALGVLLALAALLMITATASARMLASPDGASSVAASIAAPAPSGGVLLDAAEIVPDPDAGGGEFVSARIAGQSATSCRSDRISYQPAHARAATPVAVGSPLRPPRRSA